MRLFRTSSGDQTSQPAKLLGMARLMAACLMVLSLMFGGGGARLWAQAPSIALELITEPGFPIQGAQKWSRYLQEVSLTNVRIGSGRPELKLDKSGSGYRVVGVLTHKNTLRLPGGTFRYGDRTGLKNWITKLQKGGKDEIYAQRGTFGLTEKELVEIHRRLAAPVSFSTKGRPSGQVARLIVEQTRFEFTVEAAARTAFAGSDKVVEEMKGLSAGTVLAAAIRPLGLVVVPVKQLGQPAELRFMDARNAKEAWPVGWPTNKSPRELTPKLFKFLTVGVNNQPLGETLAALQGRVETPFLFDHNALARHGIELAQTKVSFPEERTFYGNAIRKVLFQGKLKSEMRVDEAGHPFLWISTIKR